METRVGMYRAQVRVRYFEKAAYDLFLQNLVKGTSHLATGQEAIAAGVSAALRPDDYVFATYRGHAHAILRGAPMPAVLAELMGRETGLMGGKGGSMHLTYVANNFMGSYAIVGAHLTIANGTAWSAQFRGTDQVTVAFFGDGTTNIGAFHEALNLAATWKLPVIFVCENNLYMEYTPISEVTAVPRPAADRASAYGLAPVAIDGNDADVVYSTALGAVSRARSGDGPSLIEAVTYRHGGHSRADPGKYRPETEVAEWLAKDPIPRLRDRLLSVGVNASLLDRIDAEARSEVDQAREEAKAAPLADPAGVERQVFADGGAQWRR
jgi:pyruvate dehydrogenase E1 component alpha subunit